MNKLILAAGLTGALALAVLAQQPPAPQGPPPEAGQPGAPIRQRIQQAMQQRGGPGGPPGGAPMMQQRMGMPHPMGMQPGGEQPKFDRGEILKHIVENPEMAKKVGLTEDQVAKLKDGQFAHEKNMIELRAKAETTKLDVRKLMEAAKVDREAVSKAIDAAAAAESAARKADVMHMLDVKETIGPDVMKKIHETVRERLQRGAMGGRGPQQGPGPQPEGKR